MAGFNPPLDEADLPNPNGGRKLTLGVVFDPYRAVPAENVAFFLLLEPVTQNMLKMRLLPGLCPGPRWGAHDATSDPLVDWGRPPLHPLVACGTSTLSTSALVTLLLEPRTFGARQSTTTPLLFLTSNTAVC